MKKEKKSKPRRGRSGDEEVYEKIKRFKEEPIIEKDLDEDVPSIFADDSDAENDTKEDDF